MNGLEAHLDFFFCTYYSQFDHFVVYAELETAQSSILASLPTHRLQCLPILLCRFSESQGKEEINFAPSGKLTAETNTYKVS